MTTNNSRWVGPDEIDLQQTAHADIVYDTPPTVVFGEVVAIDLSNNVLELETL